MSVTVQQAVAEELARAMASFFLDCSDVGGSVGRCERGSWDGPLCRSADAPAGLPPTVSLCVGVCEYKAYCVNHKQSRSCIYNH